MASRKKRGRALVIWLLAAAPSMAHAASCDSAAGMAVDLWNEYGHFAMQAGCSVASTATVAAAAGVVAQPKQVYQACLADASARERLVRQMVSSWNRLAAGRWATVGPRPLHIAAMQRGTIVAPGTRLFLTPAPLHVDAIDVAITKQAFRGPAEVTVCTHAPGGIKARRWNFTIAQGSANVGRTWLQRIPGVQGQIVSVHIVGHGVANRLKYTLEIGAAPVVGSARPWVPGDAVLQFAVGGRQVPTAMDSGRAPRAAPFEAEAMESVAPDHWRRLHGSKSMGAIRSGKPAGIAGSRFEPAGDAPRSRAGTELEKT